MVKNRKAHLDKYNPNTHKKYFRTLTMPHSTLLSSNSSHSFAFTHFFPPSHASTVQLLHKLKVRSADGKATLLKVIKNPITRHLPAGCKCYGFSVQGTLYNPSSLACALPEDKPIVFVLGAMAAGHITVNDHPYVRGREAEGNFEGKERGEMKGE